MAENEDLSLESALREALNILPTNGMSDSAIAKHLIESDSVAAWIKRQPNYVVTVNVAGQDTEGVKESGESVDNRNSRESLRAEIDSDLKRVFDASLSNGHYAQSLDALRSRMQLGRLI